MDYNGDGMFSEIERLNAVPTDGSSSYGITESKTRSYSYSYDMSKYNGVYEWQVKVVRQYIDDKGISKDTPIRSEITGYAACTNRQIIHILQITDDPDKDVTLIENADAATVTPMILHGQGQIGNGAEPQVSEGVTAGIWEEPFVKFHDLGDYSYAVLNVKKSTIQNDPETCQKFVNAMLKALKAVQQDKELAASVLKAEFPTLSDEARQATLDRAYADNIWSLDGMITEEAVDRDMDVLIKTGFFAGEYSYADLVDMQFVKSAPVN
jgi:hypothetical protein